MWAFLTGHLIHMWGCITNHLQQKQQGKKLGFLFRSADTMVDLGIKTFFFSLRLILCNRQNYWSVSSFLTVEM